MVYTSAANAIKVSGIATSQEGAKTTVARLVMQTVFDVLERQARSALLPDAVISSILGQLEVKVTYNPLNCENLILTVADKLSFLLVVMEKDYCIIVGNTVTGICNNMKEDNMECKATMMGVVKGIPANHTSISGTLMTSNIFMANWSRMMWQSVLDRAIQMLASGPFGLHFFSARATVGGN
ncbi:hypothetical protein KIN20_029411 [Parelaphostrongylus tenuis]|uniref:Uncharacterized protein n=1 Tax=Parelaphostrongylus tenuis TaxID=148309 RepID=A0AAD5R2D3_PARTN|nr:hypothetical protein KIN20_029411 [Parelaphostrongylus tenuis]